MTTQVGPLTRTIDITNPRTGELLDTYTATPLEQIFKDVHHARYAAETWGKRTPSQRSDALHDFVDRVRGVTLKLAQHESASRGIPIQQAQREVLAALDIMRFYARAAAAPTGSIPAGSYMDGYTSRVTYRPLGSIGAILPWNYPTLMWAWRVMPALAAGNTVVVKPAEQTPHTASILGSIADISIGLGAVHTIVGDRTTGRELTQTCLLDGWAFTGSLQGGRSVQQVVAPAPVSLELGGNCPAIVTGSISESDAHALVHAAFLNAGQSCAGPSRIISVDTEATELLQAAVRSYRIDTPLIRRAAVESASRRVLEAVEHTYSETVGDFANTVTDDERAGGWWLRPSMVEIEPAARVALRMQETFAPVITLEQVHSLDEALDLATDPDCGNDLAASVWSNHHREIEIAVSVLERKVGEVWINCALAQTAELPHSSRGGVDLSVLALEQYRRPTTVTTRVKG